MPKQRMFIRYKNSRYWIAKDGTVISIYKNGKIRYLKICTTDYHNDVTFCIDGVKKTMYIPTLLKEVFKI